MHGFDEFFGNLYHLNAEEEPEQEDYPKNPAFKAKFGPRGVLKCKATDQDDPTVDPRFGKIGTIEDTGPLTKKRMETVDDETSNAAIDFIKRQVQAIKPFFCGGMRRACISARMCGRNIGAAATSRHHIKYLFRLGALPSVSAGSGASLRGAVRRDVQGLPAAAKALELQRRLGLGGNVKGARRLMA